ncbi:flavin-containing monooxygenase [Arthrobacter mobilis]|uniref:NAD(P)/FAD-dependent oxidoreductase n=1 Tax=Arthrobacter mobilis TaxID=2724944 RepID=A0A7X6HH20_9MICC|nr:NAD(P)/FAD-dependent oxidoreductase [Arthrobacter mobilis]NKX55881.1 NAD(P)/FAD-dependent oxidoreductase [Arthrobacter mobilis]
MAIIGAGFSGIAAGIKLKEAGIENFTIYEKSPNVGGVWWDNRYPGAEVDTPSVLYSYSFRPWRWSRTHVRQAELLEYLEAVVDEYGLGRHIRTRCEVESAVWNEDRQRYTVLLKDGRVERFEAVVSAVGLLSDPRYPDWPGLEDFAGPRFHTSRWDHTVDLSGKTVAVVGTGSTAAQVVPSIAPVAGQVKMFQREPGWVLPKGARDFTTSERAAMNSHAAQRIVRAMMLMRREKAQYRNASWRPGTPENAAAEKAARTYIDTVFAERPDLREAVTPGYPFGGKRPILTDDFYPSLTRENVTVVPRAVSRVTKRGLVDAGGQEHEVDILVMSTGFKSDFVSTVEVIGRDGRSLNEVWNGEPQALLGIMTTGFPNFFMMYGPNTNGGAIVTHLEAQADYVVAAIKLLARGRASSVEVRDSVSQWFNSVIQQRLAGASFEGASNYYKSATGRIVTQWSDGAIVYSVLTKLLRRAAWKTRYIMPSSGLASEPTSAVRAAEPGAVGAASERAELEQLYVGS